MSALDVLHRLIPEIHQKQPESRVVVISSTPTWKMTREILRLGAADLIRRSSYPADTIKSILEL
jgi:DNA-binding NarL/FixJ family response regulator